MPPPVTFRLSDDTNSSIRDILLSRGCVEHDPALHQTCDLTWTTKQHTSAHYAAITLASSPSSRSLLNHFPHTACITQKDCLARTMRRMRAVHGAVYDFTPQSFILPRERTAWEDTVRKERQRHRPRVQEAKEWKEETKCQEVMAADDDCSLWIVKPSLSSQGRNIRLVRDPEAVQTGAGSVVVQRYLHQPHLIHGHKYDLRMSAADIQQSCIAALSAAAELIAAVIVAAVCHSYVLVTSFHPLTAYLCTAGLCRFSSLPYSPASPHLLSHLTNSSLIRHSDRLAQPAHPVIPSSCKWTLQQYLSHLAASSLAFSPARWWRRIRRLVLLTLVPLCTEVGVVRGAFELLGFDVLTDASHKLWLIEVNRSPAIAVAGAEDRDVKLPMLSHLLDVVGVPQPAAAAATSETEAKEGDREERKGRRSAKISPLHSRRSSWESGGADVLSNVGCWSALWPAAAAEAELNAAVTEQRVRGEQQPALVMSRYVQSIVETVKRQQRSAVDRLSAAALCSAVSSQSRS